MKYWVDGQSGSRFCEPDNVDEQLQLIWEIGCDYDGYGNSLEGLRSLVDELIEMSQKARVFLRDGKLFPEEENLNS